MNANEIESGLYLDIQHISKNREPAKYNLLEKPCFDLTLPPTTGPVLGGKVKVSTCTASPGQALQRPER